MKIQVSVHVNLHVSVPVSVHVYEHVKVQANVQVHVHVKVHGDVFVNVRLCPAGGCGRLAVSMPTNLVEILGSEVGKVC